MDYMTDSQISSRSFTSTILYGPSYFLSDVVMLKFIKFGMIFSYKV